MQRIWLLMIFVPLLIGCKQENLLAEDVSFLPSGCAAVPEGQYADKRSRAIELFESSVGMQDYEYRLDEFQDCGEKFVAYFSAKNDAQPIDRIWKVDMWKSSDAFEIHRPE